MQVYVKDIVLGPGTPPKDRKNRLPLVHMCRAATTKSPQLVPVAARTEIPPGISTLTGLFDPRMKDSVGRSLTVDDMSRKG